MKNESRVDNAAQKAVDFLDSTGALDLGNSPWETYSEDDTVLPVDFDELMENRSRDSQIESSNIPTEFEAEIASLLEGGDIGAAIPAGFGRRAQKGVNAGKEVAAWYQSLHYHASDWGIFIREEHLLRRALEIVRFVASNDFVLERSQAAEAQRAGKPFLPCWRLSDAELFIRAALVSVYLHEHYHHRIECLALRLHVVTRIKLFIPYFENVYKPALGTDDLLEEALANASMYLRLQEDTYRKLLPPSVRNAMKRYFRATFPQDPPGYRKALDYLDQASFNAGENRLQGYMRETTLHPVQPSAEWDVAPQLTRSFLNIKSNIYTVVPMGAQSVLAPDVMALTCSTEQMIRVCKRAGFAIRGSQGKGSHTVMAKEGEKSIVTIPKRKDLSITVIKNTLSTIGNYKVADLPRLLKF